MKQFRVKGLTLKTWKNGCRYEPQRVFTYTDAAGSVVATIEDKYWRSGANDAYHNWRSVLTLNRERYTKGSTGFGSRTKILALNSRTEATEEFVEYVEKFVANGELPPAWLKK